MLAGANRHRISRVQDPNTRGIEILFMERLCTDH